MSESLINAVLEELPARAIDVQQRLGFSHEQTYAALVALESRGAAILVPTWTGNRSEFTWEPT